MASHPLVAAKSANAIRSIEGMAGFFRSRYLRREYAARPSLNRDPLTGRVIGSMAHVAGTIDASVANAIRREIRELFIPCPLKVVVVADFTIFVFPWHGFQDFD